LDANFIGDFSFQLLYQIYITQMRIGEEYYAVNSHAHYTQTRSKFRFYQKVIVASFFFKQSLDIDLERCEIWNNFTS